MRYAIGNSENLLMNKYHRLTLVLAIVLALGFGSAGVRRGRRETKDVFVCRRKASKRSWRRRRKTT